MQTLYRSSWHCAEPPPPPKGPVVLQFSVLSPLHCHTDEGLELKCICLPSASARLERWISITLLPTDFAGSERSDCLLLWALSLMYT